MMKKIFNRIAYLVGYLFVFFPIIFSIYYSVPASDDFAAATRRNGKSLLSQSCFHGFGMWKTWGGRWLTQFVQTLVNPLNSHEHLGHKYGIYMIVVFVITTACIIYGIKVILERVLGKESKYTKCILFLTVVILFSTNYYSECYNWYVGAMVYTIPFACIFIAIASMIKYVESEECSNLHYWIMIIAGIFPATIEYCDLPMGIIYLYLIYICRWNVRLSESLGKKIKNLIPLIVYVVLGISNVFAPGNALRQQYYNLDLSVSRAFIQTTIDIILRIQDLIVDKPFIMMILVIVFFIGIFSNSSNQSENKIVMSIVFLTLLTYAGLFPYVYGRAFTNSYLDIRMEYVLDYCLELAAVIVALKMGRFISNRLKLQFNAKEVFLSVVGIVLISYIAIIVNYGYLKIMQIDLLRNRGVIVESYNYWNDIITEIEESDEDDVVIYRDSEPNWSRYFFPFGLTDGETFAVPYDKVYDEEYIMPNVYYEKNSITLHINKEEQ